MTTSFAVPSEPTRPDAAAAIAIAIIASVTVLGLFVAGITFAALAIAFPMVAPIADQSPTISAGDIALAEQFADAWWVFAVLAVGSLVAAGVVAVKSIQHLSPTPRD